MTNKKKSKRQDKRENKKPEEDSFGLDMDFEEALQRFLNVDPKEADEEEQKPSQKSSETG